MKSQTKTDIAIESTVPEGRTAIAFDGSERTVSFYDGPYNSWPVAAHTGAISMVDVPLGMTHSELEALSRSEALRVYATRYCDGDIDSLGWLFDLI